MPVPVYSQLRVDAATRAKRAELRSRCSKHCYLHGTSAGLDEYAGLLGAVEGVEDLSDTYGTGGLVAQFESELAELFDKTAVAFMPSGTMAQQIALRVACDRRRWNRIAFHATCHLNFNEFDAYHELHGLHADLIGDVDRVFTVADLERLPHVPAAIVLELPYRWLGGALPDWDEVEAIQAWCRLRGVHLHLDGARIWETMTAYGRSLAEISAGFDSVYVSFYKTLGAFAGAALLGTGPLVDQSRVWMRRQGGNLPRIDPLVVSARSALQRRLPLVAEYVNRMQTLAPAVVELPGCRLVPQHPLTNMAHLYFNLPAGALHRGRDTLAREKGIWITNGFFPLDDETCFKELFIGDVLLNVGNDTYINWLTAMLEGARRERDTS